MHRLPIIKNSAPQVLRPSNRRTCKNELGRYWDDNNRQILVEPDNVENTNLLSGPYFCIHVALESGSMARVSHKGNKYFTS